MPGLSAIIQTPLAAALHSGWRWWIDELYAAAPQRPKTNGKTKATSELWLSRDAIRVDRVADGVGERFAEGRPIETLDMEGWQELSDLIADTRARIILAAPDIYTASLTLPKAARGRLRSAVMLQLGEISPLDPAMLSWSTHNVRRTGEHITLQVVMAKTRRLDGLVSLFAENGLPTPPIMAVVAGAFVQLAAGYDGSRARPANGGRRTLLFAGALLAAIPPAIIIAASILIATNDRASERLEEAVRPKIEAETRARHAEQLRAALAPVQARSPVSSLLDNLAGRLPTSAWVRSIGERPDGTVEFEIDALEPETVRAALADDPLLLDLQEVDRSLTEDGRASIRYLANRI